MTTDEERQALDELEDVDDETATPAPASCRVPTPFGWVDAVGEAADHWDERIWQR